MTPWFIDLFADCVDLEMEKHGYERHADPMFFKDNRITVYYLDKAGHFVLYQMDMSPLDQLFGPHSGGDLSIQASLQGTARSSAKDHLFGYTCRHPDGTETRPFQKAEVA